MFSCGRPPQHSVLGTLQTPQVRCLSVALYTVLFESRLLRLGALARLASWIAVSSAPSNVSIGPACLFVEAASASTSFHLDDVIIFRFLSRSSRFTRSSTRLWWFLRGIPGRRRSSSWTAIMTFWAQQGTPLRAIAFRLCLRGPAYRSQNVTIRCCGVDGKAPAINEILNECTKQSTKIIDGSVRKCIFASSRSILERLHSGSSQACGLIPSKFAQLTEFVGKAPDET